MPFIYSQNQVAVRLEELVPRFWSKYDTLKKELYRYKDKPFGVKRIQVGGNGREMLVDFDTLHRDIREALGDPRKKDNPLEQFFILDPEAYRYYGSFKRGNDYLTADEREKYLVNASVLQAVVKLEQARFEARVALRGSTTGIMATLISDVEHFQNYLRVNHNLEHTLPTSKRFKEVLKAFKENGYYSVIKDPTGASKQNARKVDDSVEMLLNALFQNQQTKPTPTQVARSYNAFLTGYAEVYNADTGELYDPKAFKALSQGTIISYINKWENRIATHATRSANRQEYMSKYKPHHQMELPTLAGSLISIDDRQPPFMYEKGKRAWFYIGMDVASQCITTVVHGKSKEGLIIEFYREMVRQYTAWGVNLPLELECESSLNSSYRDTLLRPGAMFDNVRIEANNARGKYIERAFGSLRYEIEKHQMGWIGRPHAKSEANQTDPSKVEFIPYDELIPARLADLEMWNNAPHPTRKDMTRWEYFLNNQNPDCKPTNWMAILPVIGYKEKTSCKLGYVTLQGRKRAIAENGEILTGKALISKMRVIEGKDFDVYWLDDQEGGVLKAIVFIDGRPICEIMEMPRYNRATAERGENDEAARTLQSAYVASVEAFGRTQRNRIENIQIIDNTPRTLNTAFQFSRLNNRFAANSNPVEIMPDKEDDLMPMPVKPSSGDEWKRNFTL